ncbi:hypothetical protein C2S51_024034 [Perilla frutescens var. frutescens]|nr:hypothetical protein C2S51_024034 [Perilla frutescens var. frutescens]
MSEETFDQSPTTSSPPPTSPESPKLHNRPDLVSDIVLWRRKRVNVMILSAAAAAWVAMDVYDYHFITLLSWFAIAALACLFFWGSMHRFLKKEAADLSEFEISEAAAAEEAELLRRAAEEGIRLMFHVSVEREWFVFGGVVLSLSLISLAASRFDFLTLCLIGIVGAMSLPLVYVKNEKRIREFAEKLKMKSQRLKVMIEEKMQKIKNKIAGKRKEIKGKKSE